MRGQQEGLLERIWREVRCPYLSDLRLDPAFRGRIAWAVGRIPAAAFSDGEWREALAYLTGEKTAGQEARALRGRLLEQLRGKTPLDSRERE